MAATLPQTRPWLMVGPPRWLLAALAVLILAGGVGTAYVTGLFGGREKAPTYQTAAST